MRRDRIIQALAGVVLALALAGGGAVSGELTASAGRHRLTYADTAEEGDPPEVALGIAMGAFRGVFVNFLWHRANELKEEGKYYEANELSRAITRLQPRFPQVWVFHAWNMAYNISVATQTPAERWQWVQSGIRLLRSDGLRANPNDMLIHKELAWIFLHKIGGATDDANQFYKRKLAEEWTIVLGEPPTNAAGERSREQAVERFAAWLTPIAQAPDTPEALAQANPKAATLREVIGAEVGDSAAQDILKRHALHSALNRSFRRDVNMASMSLAHRRFNELLADPAYADAWSALLAHLRRRVLIDDYNMEPERMVRYTRKYGPIDWRHPAAHSLYWSARGVEESLTRWTEENKRDFDFINTDRVTNQSLQELYRSGMLYFSFLDWVSGGKDFYLAAVNPWFVDSYGEVLDELMKRSWADRDKRPYRVYAAGYENFLSDAIRYFYRRGDIAKADELYTKLGTYPGQNVNDPGRSWNFSRPVGEFVLLELSEDRILSNYVVVSEVVGGLEGAFFQGLLQNDMDMFTRQMQWAAQAHRYFMENQRREVAASDPGVARNDVLDPDFRFVAGTIFARILQMLPVDDAALMYFRAPADLQVYAFDQLRGAWQQAIDEAAQKSGGKTFAELFPEPSGMEAHRAYVALKERERLDQRVDIEQK